MREPVEVDGEVSTASPSDKPSLRAALRRRRRTLAAEHPNAAAQAAALLPLDRLPPVRVVAGYHPLGSEFDPGPILQRLAARGAVLAFPVVAGPDEPLIFRAPDGDADLRPDLILAPLLAFDGQGGRLGQGGGHYDRTIAHLRAAGPLLVVGLAFAGQEVDAVPAEPHDARLDAILTETGYREV